MGRTRKAAEKPAEAPAENEDVNHEWGANDEAAEERADDAGDQEGDETESDGDDQGEDEDEGGDGEGDPEEDLAAVSRVDHDADKPAEAAFYDEEKGEGLTLGRALTPRQVIGLDAENPAEHIRQASDRRTLSNGQTDHERDNALDPVSGTPNPGVTRDVRHSAPGKLGASDMSGGLPKADPFAAAGPEVKRVMDVLGKASRKAMQDGKRGHGYVNLKTLNVHKSIMDALVEGGHVTVENSAGGHFNPETGTVYRVASHVEP